MLEWLSLGAGEQQRSMLRGFGENSSKDHFKVGIQGFLSEFARFVDDRLTIIVLMNLDDADPELIVHGVAAFYLPASVAARAP